MDSSPTMLLSVKCEMHGTDRSCCGPFYLQHQPTTRSVTMCRYHVSILHVSQLFHVRSVSQVVMMLSSLVRVSMTTIPNTHFIKHLCISTPSDKHHVLVSHSCYQRHGYHVDLRMSCYVAIAGSHVCSRIGEKQPDCNEVV